MDVRIVPATADQWPGLVRVMQTPGDPEECWCQVFRVPREEWEARTVDQNRSDLERLVSSGTAPGLVALDGDDAVGWVSVAPLAEFVRLAAAPLIAAAREPDDDLTDRWVVSCFVVRPPARGRGLLPRLLDAAVSHAIAQGARSIEAYPLDPARAEEVGPDELYAGAVSQFSDAGFVPVGDLGPSRSVMVRQT